MISRRNLLKGAAVGLALSNLTFAQEARSSTLGPAIWFSPHQDDEVNSMGVHIKYHVAAGRRCIVVLMTDGGASGVCPRYPSREEFVAERDREFTTAVTRMGAEPVIRQDRMPDGTLTEEYALSVMQEYYAQYPNGSFKTMTDQDNHPDHAALGRALRQSDIEDARYYVKREQWREISGHYIVPDNPDDLRDELLDYAPVAWLSVRKNCEACWNDPRSKYHI